MHLDKQGDFCDCLDPCDKVPGQGVIHVGVEYVDSARCADLVMWLYSKRQVFQILIRKILSYPVPAWKLQAACNNQS